MLWKNRNTAYHMQCKSILYNILSIMQSEYGLKYTTSKTAALLAPAIDFIKRSYTMSNLSVSMLSEMCEISEDYFRKLFKSIFGISPIKYINSLRMSFAKELLSSEMYAVSEVAELSGYSDMCYFSRKFKEAVGVSPTEFKG